MPVEDRRGGASSDRMNDTSHIVVVDDQKEICDVVQEYLTGEGYRVSTANDGAAITGRVATNKMALDKSLLQKIVFLIIGRLPVPLQMCHTYGIHCSMLLRSARIALFV